MTSAEAAQRKPRFHAEPDCPHPNAVGFVCWEHPMATIGGRERQVANWCPDCGALGLWSEDGDRVEWVRPGMVDCSAQDTPRTPFRDPGAGVVAGAGGEGLCGADMSVGEIARMVATGPSPYAELSYRVSERAVALQEQALLEWADQAGVRPETLVSAGIIPRVKTELRGDEVVITVEARKMPMRERRESEAEFVERVRRMPR